MDFNLKEQKYTSKYAHNQNTDWLSKCSYGLFFHILPTKENFENIIEGFDPEQLAKECFDCGADYVFITIGQNSGLINIPSKVYEKYTGRPELCSNRDIAEEMYRALNRYGIKLMLYAPAGAPKDDSDVAKSFGAIKLNKSYTKDWIFDEVFEQRWSEFLKELSQRYTNKVQGWWIDGSYEWSGFCNRTGKYYSEALKSGNPNAIVAFNGGVNSMFYPTEYDDYTAGEWGILDNIVPSRRWGKMENAKCDGRWINGIQWHILTFISEFWGEGEIDYTPEQIAARIVEIKKKGGAVTLDVPMESNLTHIRKDAFMIMRETGNLLKQIRG